MADTNGRWRRPAPLGNHDDPDEDFPFRQTFTDCAGRARNFVISYSRTGTGFRVQAEEEGKDDHGFFFREFDANSPYPALGRLRRRIRKTLATRHIEQLGPGEFQATHDIVRGRIAYWEDEVAFIIDGQRLTLQEFGKMIATFEGFEFELEIIE